MLGRMSREWLAKYISGDSRIKQERHGIFRLNYDKKQLEFAVQTSEKDESPLIIVSYPVKYLKKVEISSHRSLIKKHHYLELYMGDPPNNMVPRYSFSLNDLQEVKVKIVEFQEEIKSLEIGKASQSEVDIIEIVSKLLAKPINQIQSLFEDVTTHLMSLRKSSKKIGDKIIDAFEIKPIYEIKEVEINSRNVHYYEYNINSPQTLVILSPIGGKIQHLFPLIRHLADINVIILGQRGYESALDQDKDFKLKNYIKDLEDFLDFLGNKREIILAAHSLFTAIILEKFLDSQNYNITKIILISGLHRAPDNFRKGVKALPPTQMWNPFKGQIKRMAPKILFGKETDNEIIDAFISEAFQVPNEVYNQIFRDFLPRFDYSKNLQFINIPILLLWGNEDQIIPSDLKREMMDFIPTSKLSYKVLSGGHMIILENPSLIGSEIRRFCLRKGREINIE